MAKNKIKLQFGGFEEYAARLDELGGSIAEATEKALELSQKHVSEKLNTIVQENKYPAKGVYSTGDTKKSIINDAAVKWEGTTASINVGFDFKISGLNTIMLMHGTPKMKPMNGLKAAIYGNTTRKEIQAIQERVFDEEIKKIMGGE